MIDIDTNINKPSGFPNNLTEADIRRLALEEISSFYKHTIVETLLNRINENEDRIKELESFLEIQNGKSVSDVILTEKRSKLDIRADMVFSELKKAKKLDSASIISICSLGDKDYKTANSIMARVATLHPETAKVELHKKPGQRKGKKWLSISNCLGV